MIALSTARKGDRGTVAKLDTQDQRMISRMLALGISPGTPIYLEQRFPSYIVRMGHTRASLDDEIAKSILIKVHPFA